MDLTKIANELDKKTEFLLDNLNILEICFFCNYINHDKIAKFIMGDNEALLNSKKFKKMKEYDINKKTYYFSNHEKIEAMINFLNGTRNYIKKTNDEIALYYINYIISNLNNKLLEVENSCKEQQRILKRSC